MQVSHLSTRLFRFPPDLLPPPPLPISAPETFCNNTQDVFNCSKLWTYTEFSSKKEHYVYLKSLLQRTYGICLGLLFPLR